MKNPTGPSMGFVMCKVFRIEDIRIYYMSIKSPDQVFFHQTIIKNLITSCFLSLFVAQWVKYFDQSVDNWNMKKNILIFFSAFTIYLGMLGIMAFNYEAADSEQSSTDPHKEAECATCHKMVSSINNTGYAITNQDCLKCHDPNTISSNLKALNFHKDPTRNCLDCHSFHDKSTIQAKGTNFKFNFDSPSMRMQDN